MAGDVRVSRKEGVLEVRCLRCHDQVALRGSGFVALTESINAFMRRHDACAVPNGGLASAQES